MASGSVHRSTSGEMRLKFTVNMVYDAVNGIIPAAL